MKRVGLLFNYDWDALGFAQSSTQFEFDEAGFDLFSFPSNAHLLTFDMRRFAQRPQTVRRRQCLREPASAPRQPALSSSAPCAPSGRRPQQTPTGADMKSVAFRMLCRVLIVSLFAMSFQPAMAGVIATDQAITTTERAALISTLSRSDVAGQLLAQGVDTDAAKLRVASMTDQEVAALAGKIDSLPAGASSSSTGWAVAIVAVLVIWYFWK